MDQQRLMALFFLVVGLEARREFDLGDLRRFLLPIVAGLVGMIIPIAIFLGGQCRAVLPGLAAGGEGLG